MGHHTVKDETAADDAALRDWLQPKPGQRPVQERHVSPFVLDLKPPTSEPEPEQKPVRTATPKPTRRLPHRWQMMLDERIHLKEMRHRSVSVRPRGWKDLPPKEAVSLANAVAITFRRFLSEHPMAELTAVALVQTMAVLAYRMTVRPVLSLLPERRTRTETPTTEPNRQTLSVDLLVEDVDDDAVSDEATPDVVAHPKLRLPTMPVVRLPKPNLGRLLPSPIALPRLRLAPAWAVASIALAVLLPFGAYRSYQSISQVKSDAMSEGLLAMASLKQAQEAAQTSDLAGLQAAFGSASDHFARLKDRLGALSVILTAAGSVVPSSDLSTAGLMLVAGEQLSTGGQRLASGLKTLESDVTPSEKLRGLEIQFARAMPHLTRATEAIELMSADSLPIEYRGTLDRAKSELPRLVDGMDQITRVSGFLALMLGSEQPKRYLLVFQNDSELRATGGFIGSFALLDVDRGEITNLEIPGGGSYDLQGSLTERLIAPRPLRLINPHWQFQDANWSPDFPDSARRLAWFYEKSGGPTVDGVIAINARVMERLLEVVGPVEMPEYEVALTADNFMAETQREVEIDYDRETNRPKQIISDLAPIVLERVMGSGRDSYLPLAEAVNSSLSERDIQMWFGDPDLQNRAVQLGWSGEIRTSPGDYLQVVHTNIAGQKTDAVMSERIRHDAKVLADGSALVTLTVSRTHHGEKGAQFTGVRNVDYLRIYVPLGSTLVEASGFEAPDPKLFKLPDPEYLPDPELAQHESSETIDRRSGTRTSVEAGNTVFANWVQIDPGQTGEVTITYQLPPGTVERRGPNTSLISSLYTRLTSGSSNRSLNYSLLVQRQSGTVPAEVISSVDLPRGYAVVWSSPDHQTDERGREVATDTLSHDLFFGVTGEMPIR
ncbi:MAG: DUF4012 domain-containing protein [bacterium]